MQDTKYKEEKKMLEKFITSITTGEYGYSSDVLALSIAVNAGMRNTDIIHREIGSGYSETLVKSMTDKYYPILYDTERKEHCIELKRRNLFLRRSKRSNTPIYLDMVSRYNQIAKEKNKDYSFADSIDAVYSSGYDEHQELSMVSYIPTYDKKQRNRLNYKFIDNLLGVIQDVNEERGSHDIKYVIYLNNVCTSPGAIRQLSGNRLNSEIYKLDWYQDDVILYDSIDQALEFIDQDDYNDEPLYHYKIHMVYDNISRWRYQYNK